MEFEKDDESILVSSILKHLDHIEKMVHDAMVCLTDLRIAARSPEFVECNKDISDIILSSDGFYFLNEPIKLPQEELNRFFQQELSPTAELLYNKELSQEAERLYHQAITILLEADLTTWLTHSHSEEGITLTHLLLSAKRYCTVIIAEFTLPATFFGDFYNLANSYLESYKEHKVPLLKKKLPEILKFSQNISELYMIVSTMFRNLPKMAAEQKRINNSKKTHKGEKNVRWQNVKKTIHNNFAAIYSPGYSLNEVALNITIEMGKNSQDPPGPQTIKRYLKEFANITSNNVDQMSHLFNNGDSC